jgi:hypothetical protein
MSNIILTAHPHALPGDSAPPPEWIRPAAASRIIRRHINAVKSYALAGGIRVRALPGARTLGSRADCERLAATG